MCISPVRAPVSSQFHVSKLSRYRTAAYIEPPGTSDFAGFDILKQVNVEILETAVRAVERACPRLQFWTLQTGGKVYSHPWLVLTNVPTANTVTRDGVGVWIRPCS
jgi:hypothetical protein